MVGVTGTEAEAIFEEVVMRLLWKGKGRVLEKIIKYKWREISVTNIQLVGD